MGTYENFQSNAAEIPAMRKWLCFALIVSLLLHTGLVIFFKLMPVETVAPVPAASTMTEPVRVRVVLPAFHDSESEPSVLQETKRVEKIVIPETTPKLPDEVAVKPNAREFSVPLLSDNPATTDFSGSPVLDVRQSDTVAALERQLDGLTEAQIDKSAPQPLLFTGAGNSDHPQAGADRVWLEEALTNLTGAAAGKPIAMSGGALFEWDKADLRPEAVAALRKLATLIAHYPNAAFVISGHTDHTGTREANLALSQRRADAVRDWLVANLGIDPARITTIGKADDEALPELGPGRSIEEQAPNRRVEIVIKTQGK